MLHTVNKSPFEKNSLETCLRLAEDNSSILLIEDGVYGALKNTSFESSIISSQKVSKFYVLGPILLVQKLLVLLALKKRRKLQRKTDVTM